MRKQYHFRKSEKGLLAWDVDRLILLSKSFPVHKINLKNIKELDEAYWYGNEGDKPTCRSIIHHMQLAQEVNLRYPIILSSDGKVMDGMHRVAKAVLKGLETIEAVQFINDPEPDYIGCHPDDLPY